MVRKTSPGWRSKLCIQEHITLIKTLRGWNVCSVMGRRVAFQCDVLTMVLHESNPGFPLILPRNLMAVNFTAFDLAAYHDVTNMHNFKMTILASTVQWSEILRGKRSPVTLCLFFCRIQRTTISHIYATPRSLVYVVTIPVATLSAVSIGVITPCRRSNCTLNSSMFYPWCVNMMQ